MLKKFSWKRVAIVYCHSENCFGQQPWENTKEDMKRFFKDNGIEVSYEARMPMEHEQGKFTPVLEEIKTKARSKYSSIRFKLSNPIMGAKSPSDHFL